MECNCIELIDKRLMDLGQMYDFERNHFKGEKIEARIKELSDLREKIQANKRL